ncbi:MAG: DUF1819 family protein [Caldilineaceae bacterium]|nr:DUF1819 family protein [Caldilineaceae bacterium]
MDRIARRLTTWHPPAWVLDDLILFAGQPGRLALQAALLMHVCRQDQLLYALVRQVVGPKWDEGSPEIDSTDVQRFLDQQASAHPEIESWTRQTRERIGSTTLAILRDYVCCKARCARKS